jgi:hypothetical protein
LKPVFFIVFTVAAVWGQYFFPTRDLLTPGLVVMLQLGPLKPAIWAGLAWMLIQEGTGGLAFGSMILFYLGLGGFFYIGRFFLEVNNVLFTILVFLFLSFFQMMTVSIMASLQGLRLSGFFTFEDFMTQAGIYFLVWLVTYNLFKKHFVHEPV